VVIGATVSTLAVWTIASPLVGLRLRVDVGPTPEVGPAQVAAATLLAGCTGWALLAALERLTRHAVSAWMAIALVVLLLSLASPLAGGATWAVRVTLVSMHLIAATVLVLGLAGTSGLRR
jgi:hypothetical protein